MGKNKKIRQKIESLEKAKQEHLRKIEEYVGPNYALVPYWKGEAKNFEKLIEKEKKKLKK